MRRLRRLGAALAAVTMFFTLEAVAAQANPALYTTPGGHIVNGRLWRTTCGEYSSTVVRCRTEIWATVVQLRGGQYAQTNTWTFNNLTYLPSPEANWTGNPLASDGEWTAHDGRRWRTECRTAATGGDACRSYAWSRTVRATRGPSGWVFTPEMGWVFNNMVRFSGSGTSSVREVPGHVLDTAQLTHTGLGPLQLGTSMTDLERLGYVFHIDDGVCEYWQPSARLRELGISLLVAGDRVDAVVSSSDAVTTSRGVGVGDPFSEAATAYADLDYHPELKSGHDPVYTYVSDLGSNEMVFLRSLRDTRFPDPTESIGMVMVREASTELVWDGC